MFKKALICGAIAVGLTALTVADANAGWLVRRAPVRRAAARAVLPPYPVARVARRAAYRPVYRPIARPYYGGYRGYGGYGPGVSVRVGGWGW